MPNLDACLFMLSPNYFHFFLFLMWGLYLFTSLLHEDVEDFLTEVRTPVIYSAT